MEMNLGFDIESFNMKTFLFEFVTLYNLEKTLIPDLYIECLYDKICWQNSME